MSPPPAVVGRSGERDSLLRTLRRRAPGSSFLKPYSKHTPLSESSHSGSSRRRHLEIDAPSRHSQRRPSASYTETCTRKMRSSASSSVSHRVAHIAVNRLGRRQIEFKVSLSVIGSCPGNNAHDIMRPKVGQHHLERAYVKVRFPVAQSSFANMKILLKKIASSSLSCPLPSVLFPAAAEPWQG